MPLTLAPLNVDLRILKVISDSKTKKHLESLGIVENSNINVISNHGGNLILIVKSVRLALNKEIAAKIFVA